MIRQGQDGATGVMFFKESGIPRVCGVGVHFAKLVSYWLRGGNIH